MSNGLRTLAIIAALAAPSLALAENCPPGSMPQGSGCVNQPATGSTAGTVSATPAPATTSPATASTAAPPAAASTAPAPAAGSTTTAPAATGTATTPAATGTATPPASGSSTPPAEGNKTCAAGLVLHQGICYPAH